MVRPAGMLTFANMAGCRETSTYLGATHIRTGRLRGGRGRGGARRSLPLLVNVSTGYHHSSAGSERGTSQNLTFEMVHFWAMGPVRNLSKPDIRATIAPFGMLKNVEVRTHLNAPRIGGAKGVSPYVEGSHRLKSEPSPGVPEWAKT